MLWNGCNRGVFANSTIKWSHYIEGQFLTEISVSAWFKMEEDTEGPIERWRQNAFRRPTLKNLSCSMQHNKKQLAPAPHIEYEGFDLNKFWSNENITRVSFSLTGTHLLNSLSHTHACTSITLSKMARSPSLLAFSFFRLQVEIN